MDSTICSLFWRLAERADPERLFPIKIDGATKELAFFSSRVAFLTHTATGEAEAALASKFKCLLRATVGCASGPALALVERALASPTLQSELDERLALMRRRHDVLRDALAAELAGSDVRVLPFNAAFFALLQLPDRLTAEQTRRRLLAEHSVGTIAFPDQNALRLAYCSIGEEQLPPLAALLARGLRA